MPVAVEPVLTEKEKALAILVPMSDADLADTINTAISQRPENSPLRNLFPGWEVVVK